MNDITLFYQHVTVLDYAYFDKQRGAVGNSLVVDVEFVGTLDHEGVIYDFSHAKKKVKEIIDLECDHRFLVPKNLVEKTDDSFSVSQKYKNGKKIIYKAPEQAFCLIECNEINEGVISRYLEKIILKKMPREVLKINIFLKKEKQALKGDLFFHYTHGLKDHYGNCQRLLHGHRSTLEVLVDNSRDRVIEKDLVENFFQKSVHFIYWKNIKNKSEITSFLNDQLPEGKFNFDQEVTISYHSGQGAFELSLPLSDVYILQSETTVELLSLHFLKIVKDRVGSGIPAMVLMCEGIGKGAKSSA